MYPGAFVATTPDKPAVIMAGSGEQLTYAELDARSARLARYLYEHGLRRGDTLAMLSDNSITAFEIYWAAMRSGLYFTAVNHNLSADEVGYVLADSGAVALVTSGAKADVAEALPNLPNLRIRLAFGAAVRGHGDYEAALASVSAEPLEDQPRGSDMLYSSGTTGRPKGVQAPLPQRQVSEPGDPYVALFVPYFAMSAESVYLSPAPIYHAAPLRFCATLQSIGATVVLMDKFDAEKMLESIERYGATHVQVVPTMFVRALKLDDEARSRYDLSSLQVVIHAAAPCPPEVKRAMIEWWGPIITEYYASTEGNGGTFIATADWQARPGSVGRPFMGIAHVCDDDGQELPAGEVGLVYFERDELPFVYHNDPVRTAEAQHPEHPTWTAIGDVGYLDEEGFLFLTDRKSFMIISGGVNIYPQEIENALALHPLVDDVAVIGVPDDEMGQRVKAFVKLASGASVGSRTTEELTRFLHERIARFKVPREFAYVADVPRTPTGKLAKHKLLAV